MKPPTGPVEESVINCDCGTKFKVVNSRVWVIGGLQTMWRQRKCPNCGSKKTTLELDESLAKDVLADL